MQHLASDKYTELISFVDLGDKYTNYAIFKSAKELATHILVFDIKLCQFIWITNLEQIR